MTASRPLHVAIVGGGITGLVLAIGLRARGVSFTLYERASGFSEFGAGIGLSPNAEIAMTLLDPQLHAAFKEAVTPNGLDYFQWIDGFNTNDHIFKLHLGKDGFQGGRRSEILGAWAALVDQANVQFNKEVVSVEDPKDGPVTLHFADGTTSTAHVVIGADGVWSRMRTLLFGPEYRATYSRQYCFRAVVPMEGAVAALGEDRSSSRFMYNGPGAHAITYPVAKGAMLNVLVVVQDPKPWTTTDTDNQGKVSTDTGVANRQTTGRGHREDAEKVFEKWQATPRGVVSLLPETPDRWAIFDMLEHPVPAYNRGRIALAGDAAHAAGPHLGAGAGFGIEDALALSTIFAEVKDPSTVDSALSAYSKVRYERTQWLVRATRDAVDLFQWQGPDPNKGKDAATFGPEITWRFHTVWKYDLEQMQAEVKALYVAALGAK
ncbi:hypothetical protein Sste5346_007957 [Sporothrix stenoceras]|uniref:FAD-binding domain-containing protein n=1 Tax=Sporothrix stenoceras TaxID=5173 RepID=A0ABR3YSI5_9PEZI